MKRKQKLLSILLTAAMLCSLFAGCETGRTAEPPKNEIAVVTEINVPADEPGPATVLVEQGMKDRLRELFRELEILDPERLPDVQFEYIPRNSAERTAYLEHLRVEIMAGGGPDGYLLFTCPEYCSLGEETLFPYPQKMMANRYFRPLNDLIEASNVLGWEELDEACMAAGRKDGMQYLLPVLYSYPLLGIKTSLLSDGAHYGDWQQMLDSKRPDLWNALASAAYDYPTAMFPQLADFENETIIPTREECAAMLGSIAEKDIPDAVPDVPCDCPVFSVFTGYWQLREIRDSRRDFQLFPLYNTEGGVTARIDLYAAVSASSVHAREAFKFFELFFLDELVSGTGYNGGTVWNDLEQKSVTVMKLTQFYEWGLMKDRMGDFFGLPGISTKKECLEAFYLSGMEPERAQALRDCAAKVTAAYYPSRLEKVWKTAFFKAPGIGADEAKLQQAADRVYNELLMCLAES